MIKSSLELMNEGIDKQGQISATSISLSLIHFPTHINYQISPKEKP